MPLGLSGGGVVEGPRHRETSPGQPGVSRFRDGRRFLQSTAFGLAALVVAVNPASESSAAQTVTPRKTVAVAVAAQFTTAQTITPQLASAAVGIPGRGASEWTTSRRSPGQSPGRPGLSWFERRHPSLAPAARPPSIGSVGEVATFSLAQPITPVVVKVRTITPAAESETSAALTGRITVTVGLAAQSALAQPIAVKQALLIPISPALEGDAAQTVSGGVLSKSAGGARDPLTAHRAPGQSPGFPGLSWLRSERSRPLNFVKPGLVAKFVAIVAATETDTALLPAHRKVHAVSGTAETDAAQAITRVKRGTLGTALETDAAQALGRSKARALGLPAAELDTARLVARPGQIAVPVGPALETDLAQTVAVKTRRLIGTAVETDGAHPITVRKRVAIAPATETDAALGVARHKTRTVGLVSETDAALVITRHKRATVFATSEIDTPQPVQSRHRQSVGTAGELDTARSIVSAAALAVPVGTTTETDAAQAIRWQPQRRFVGAAPETDAAQSLAHAKRHAVPVALETDAARAIAHSKRLTVGQVAETDTARAIAVKTRRLVGPAPAQETDTAHPVTYRAMGLVSPASETDLAHDITPRTGSLPPLLITLTPSRAPTLATVPMLQFGTRHVRERLGAGIPDA